MTTQNNRGLVMIVAGIVCLAGLAFLVQSDTDAPDSTSPSETPPTTSGDTVQFPGDAITQKVDARPLWESMPKPTLALLLTIGQHGYFEPCGCTASQLGGMSRRANLVEKLKEVGWDVRGIDGGGLSRRTSQQAAMKMDTTLRALHQLNYIAVGLGTEELLVGVDKLLEVHMNTTNIEASVPFVCGNVKFLGGALEGFPLATRIVEASGLKIGVASVLSPQLKKEVFPLPEAEWTDPEPVIKAALREFDEQGVDVRVLISQSEKEESKQYAETFGDFDIVLTARGFGDPDPTGQPERIGDTLLIEPGRKGKYVGVLGIYPDEDPKFRYRLVTLEREDFDDTQSMITLMENYQRDLKDFQIAKTDVVSAAHPSGATFVGANKCGECHTEAFKIWEETPHAHAFESLDPVHKRHGYERLNGVNRTFDPECLACHVTGWDPQEYIRFKSGFLNVEFAETDEEKKLQALFVGNQCENCHGPGSAHVAAIEEGEENAGDTVRVTLEESKKTVCGRCHDADNSPNFDFDTYWPKVEHSGLD